MAFDNNKLGELRPNQIITTFGPGSVVDAVKDSVTILDISYWKQKGQKIIDGRLAVLFLLLSDARIRRRVGVAVMGALTLEESVAILCTCGHYR